MKNKKALITGSFDPPTYGHLDIIKRASEMFDSVTVCIFKNSSKKYMFSEELRLEMLKALCRDIKNVTVDSSDKPVAVYAKDISAQIIVKGARNAVDFEYEKNLHNVGLDINPSLETVILFSRPENERISSSTARELLSYSLDTSKYLTSEVRAIIDSKKK